MIDARPLFHSDGYRWSLLLVSVLSVLAIFYLVAFHLFRFVVGEELRWFLLLPGILCCVLAGGMLVTLRNTITIFPTAIVFTQYLGFVVRIQETRIPICNIRAVKRMAQERFWIYARVPSYRLKFLDGFSVHRSHYVVKSGHRCYAWTWNSEHLVLLMNDRTRPLRLVGTAEQVTEIVGMMNQLMHELGVLEDEELA